MLKALCGLAAGGLLLAFATVTPADAKARNERANAQTESQMTDVSAGRRYHRRHGYRGHRGWRGPRYAYRSYRPYYGGYYPYYAPRAYYAPRPYYGFGPSIGFGFGFGPRWY